jgi:hypothetical protein
MHQHPSLNGSEETFDANIRCLWIYFLASSCFLSKMKNDVELHLRKAGARVITAGYLNAALYMTEHPDLSGAVVND